MKAPAAVLLLLVLAACEREQPVVIDGSSPAAFERTAAGARSQLPHADRLIFDRALSTVGGRRHSVRDVDALARLTFDGMTGSQVIEDQRAHDR